MAEVCRDSRKNNSSSEDSGVGMIEVGVGTDSRAFVIEIVDFVEMRIDAAPEGKAAMIVKKVVEADGKGIEVVVEVVVDGDAGSGSGSGSVTDAETVIRELEGCIGCLVE